MRFGTNPRKWMRLMLAAFVVLAGAAALMSSSTPPFRQNEKAYYADEATVNFVRPGLIFKIQKVDIAADGTVKVTFSMTDPKGLPLDRDGITTPGAVSSSFVLAYISNGDQFYRAYTTRLKTSTYQPTIGKQAIQASSDTGGTYMKMSDGVYMYTAGLKLPSGYEKTATHSVGVYGSRNLTEFDLGTNYASDVFTFVPDGSAVKNTRDIIATKSCNKCHEDLNFHGGSRKGMPMCILCHHPGGYTAPRGPVSNLNPETDNTIDMQVMIHKIHAGSSLPSVQAGTPYQIVGFGNAVSDFSDVAFPASGPNNCQACHEAGQPNGDYWLKKPSRAACGACHDNVNFATGENHVSLPQPNDNQCANCHIPQGEIDFDASILGSHVVETKSSMLSGINVKITSLDNTQAGQKPTVNFTLTDNSGTSLDPAKVNRVAVTLAGGTDDYGSSALPPTGYVTESAATAKAVSGGYQYQMATAIPANAKGTFTIAMEARVFETVLAGTLKQREIEYGAINPVVYFSVDGSKVVPRRKIVDINNCNKCHDFLSLHGTNRNQTEYCVVCHNPKTTDVSRRADPKLLPAEGIDFAMMIHRIHAGEEQTRDYTIYGFGNTPHNYNGVVFPAPLNNCDMCHASGTWNVPVGATLDKVDPRGLMNPVKPATAACTGCHTSVDAASHALANTTTLGESCGACHGVGKEFDVNKVHAN